MENGPSNTFRASGLRPPTKTTFGSSISSNFGLGLAEISESESNKRIHQPQMATTTTGVKRPPQQAPQPQPDPKRKTLIERAGECGGSKSALPVGTTPARHGTGSLKGTSIVEISNKSNGVNGGSRLGSSISYSSSVRQPSSNINGLGAYNSHSASIGLGNRPSSRAQHGRQHSTSTQSRPAGLTRVNSARNGIRPATAMDTREEKSSGKQNNGMNMAQTAMPHIPQICGKLVPKCLLSLNVSTRKVRNYKSTSDLQAHREPVIGDHTALLTERMNKLSITEDQANGDQVRFESKAPQTPSSLPVHQSDGHQEHSSPCKDRQKRGSAAMSFNPSSVKSPSGKDFTAKDFKQQIARVENSMKSVKMWGAEACSATSSPSKQTNPQFLTKYSNVPSFVAWDVDERLGTFESEFRAMKEMISSSYNDQKSREEDIAAAKARVAELEGLRQEWETKHGTIQSQLLDAERQIIQLRGDLDEEKRARRNEVEDLQRQHRSEIESRDREIARMRDDLEREKRRELDAFRNELSVDFTRQLAEAQRATAEVEKQLEIEKKRAEVRDETNERTVEAALAQHDQTRQELAHARKLQEETLSLVQRKEIQISDLQVHVAAGQQALIHFKGDEQKQVENFRLMEKEKHEALEKATRGMAEAVEARAKLRKEEIRRRKLFEQLQTLKGNIRVMCRIKPNYNLAIETAKIDTEPSEWSNDQAGKLTVHVPTKNYLEREILEPRAYDFERVFTPNDNNVDVFDEIGQLVQSAMDGQRVCIFAYGQTGSGKTHTMSSGKGAIIPSAVELIYQEAERLRDAGWQYEMWGSFVEVYNEKLFDLLGRDGTRNQVELRQDPTTKRCEVPEAQARQLHGPSEVKEMLDTAARNRTVAATKMNRESSRSHSVFTLRLRGRCEADGMISEGILNLIDLAGSERVKESQVEGLNFREAASINASLSTLGQVMAALAEGASHVPFRNSALTRLLEGCLSGNGGLGGAKTLMFVMVNPGKDEVRETVASLDFAVTVSKAKPGASQGQSGGSAPSKSGKLGLGVKKGTIAGKR